MEKGVIQEYIIFFSFFLFAGGFAVGEAFWISKKGWAGFGKSLAFSVLTNMIGFTISFFLLFVAFGVVLGMSWDGSQKYPTGFSVALVGLGLAILLVPILLILCKRIFLALLKIQTGKPAWLYSVVASIAGIIISLGFPTLLGYLLFRI